MKKENLPIRLILLVVGLFVMAFGIALSIRSDLGTTPISSAPFVYHLIYPGITVGTFSVLLNLILFVFQALLLKHDFNKHYFWQIVALVLCGSFVDLHLYLLEGVQPGNYLAKWLLSLSGCVVIAFGIFMQVKADVTLLPAEGFVMALSGKLNKTFGTVKIIVDSTLVLFSVISIFLFINHFEGVREGTVVAALLIGFIVQFYQSKITVLDKWIGEKPGKDTFTPEAYMTTDNFVITIARQYGSGGHEVGELVAKRLGVNFYDSSLIDLTAEAGGFTREFVKKNEQKLASGLLYKFYKQNYAYVNREIPPQDALFLVQTQVIRDIAARESCVIVGRCADYILKGHPNAFNVFIHANEAFRINRVISDYGTLPEMAKEELEIKDRERMNYNRYFTRREWADLKDYELTIESSLFGIEMTAAMILDARRKYIYSDKT